MSQARDVAARVVSRVLSDDAYVAPALDAELGRAKLSDPRDVGLATELAYGVLRTLGFLDETARRLSTRGKIFSEPLAQAHLYAGLYTLAFLDRVPPFAAVSESVDGVRRAVGDKPSKFANALLRGFAREIESGGRPTMEDAIVRSIPPWLRARLDATLGKDAARAYLAAGPVPPPLGLAVRHGEDRAVWAERLTAAGGRVSLGQLSPRALLLDGAGDPRKLGGHEQAFIVQEEGAQVVALALGARPGERVLDACAGRGNKTWLLAHEIGTGGRVVAADLYPSKLQALAARLQGGATIESHAVDWTIGAGDVGAGFDRVLVDAPCSGVGTLRRRPEIALHRTAEDVADLVKTQVAVLTHAAACAKDGGRIVYAVCSVLREESEEVVRAAIAGARGVTLEPAPFDAPELGPRFAAASELRLMPHVDGTDGYFIASFVARRR